MYFRNAIAVAALALVFVAFGRGVDGVKVGMKTNGSPMCEVGAFIPYDYELEYAEMTGDCWVDTLVQITEDIRIDIDFSVSDTSLDQSIFGNAAYPKRFGATLNTSLMYYSWATGGATSDASIGRWRLLPSLPNRNTMTYQNRSYSYGGYAVSTTLDFVAPNQTLLIGKYPFLSTEPHGLRVYEVKVKNADSDIDLIPVVDKSGNVRMFDKVSKAFFSHSGTGSFVAGPRK